MILLYKGPLYCLIFHILFQHSAVVDGGHYRSILRWLEYENHDGMSADGHCCDGKDMLCQINGCDHKFTICVDTMESDPGCNLLFRETEDIHNDNHIFFKDDIGGLANPIIVENVNHWFTLSIEVEDDDILDENDHVDLLTYDVPEYFIDMTRVAGGQNISILNKTRLDINVQSECMPGWCGPECAAKGGACREAALRSTTTTLPTTTIPYVPPHSGHYTTSIRLYRYENHQGNGANGQCCDGKFGLCQDNGCDHKFTFCLRRLQRRQGECDLLSVHTDSYVDRNQLLNVFDDNYINGVGYNPIIVDHLQGLSLHVTVEDVDSLNEDDLVDWLTFDMPEYFIDMTRTPEGQNVSIWNRTRLDINVKSECMPDWCGPECAATGQVCLEAALVQTTRKPPSTEPPYVGDVEDWNKRDCNTLATRGGFQYQDGVYKIYPLGSPPIDVYCDMSSRGWTLIQRRVDDHVSFDRGWEEYKDGFGAVTDAGSYWLGLENIHKLTTQSSNRLVVRMKKGDGSFVHATYGRFRVEGEETGYRLDVSCYSGDAGDSFHWNPHGNHNQNGQAFSTKDRDNDLWEDGNCAQEDRGGWWLNTCHQANLNGPYINAPFKDGRVSWPRCEYEDLLRWQCVYWGTIPDYIGYSLIYTEMKIQPNTEDDLAYYEIFCSQTNTL